MPKASTFHPSSSLTEILAVLESIILNDLSARPPLDKLSADASLMEDLRLDSVALVELIGAIEERLGFQFEDSDLRTSSFATLRSLAQVVALRLGAGARKSA